jgi:ribulose-5-phosphate 4-epimerase/fuculose-1-phosphate aldolase
MSQVVAFRAPTPQGELDEQQVRVQLAACYRLVAHYGMSDLIYTHISARVPGHSHHFLINPYGMLFSEITASSLVKIDHEGNLVEDSPYPVNKAGFVIHSAVHAARPEVNCVLHTHTRAGIAVSCLEEGLLPLNQMSLLFKDRVAYHDYEGIALDLDEQERLARDLGDKPVMILRNHGLLTTGRTVPEAFELMYYLEMSCKIQVDVMASGGRMILPQRTVQERTAAQYPRDDTAGLRAWPALLRLLDAKDPSYRE